MPPKKPVKNTAKSRQTDASPSDEIILDDAELANADIEQPNSLSTRATSTNNKSSATPSKSKMRLFVEEHYISALVGGGAALLIWLLANLLDNQILNRIEDLEKNYTSEKEARTAVDSELDKRLSIIEHDHDRQDRDSIK